MHEGGMGPQDPTRGLSRREALKRGVVLGGVALWTVPAVQVLSITEAASQQPSGMPPGRDAADVRPNAPVRRP